MVLTLDGLVPMPDEGKPRVSRDKPRGSLQDAIQAKRDCVPCREETEAWARAPLALRGYLASYTGYGQICEHLGRGLDREGIPFRFDGLELKTDFLPPRPWVVARMAGSAPPLGTPTLQLTTPWTPVRRGNPTVFFSMWETSRIKPLFVEHLNAAKAVVVPCRWNAEGFRESGVTVPIHVIPLGVDPAEGYTPKPWPQGKPFTFGMAARMESGGLRKGLNEGMAAFVRAFDRGQDVRLSVKVYPDCVHSLRVPNDQRIDVVTEPYTPAQMADWYGSIDCLFVPSKGEGWGLHTLQAMACGRPVIAAVYGGTAAFFEGPCGWELPFVEAPSGEFYAGVGNWCVPTEEGMVEALRAAFTNPEECRRKGDLAAARAQEFSWARTGRELVKILRDEALVPDMPTQTPGPAANIVDVGHGVFIGDFAACDASGDSFPLCVHVGSQLNLTEGRACRVYTGASDRADKGLSVEWSEGQPLARMSVPLEEVVAYVRRPGNVLIHCAAGACRSPTIALLAKVARGADPWEAVAAIFRRTWEGRGFPPHFTSDPTADVLRWWQSSRTGTGRVEVSS